MKKRILAAVLGSAIAVSALAPTAGAAQPNFNPGQKGNVCDAPGPNSNPNCNPR
jgi:hypothetical protein